MRTDWLKNAAGVAGSFAGITEGVSRIFRMALIVVLFIALIITSMVSCSRGNSLADKRVEIQHLQDQIELIKATTCECVNTEQR